MAWLSWLERRASDRKVAVLRSHTGQYVVVFLKKTLNANFLTCSLCAMEDSTRICFTTAFTREKKNKKQADMVLSISPKVGVGSNCLCLISMTFHELEELISAASEILFIRA